MHMKRTNSVVAFIVKNRRLLLFLLLPLLGCICGLLLYNTLQTVLPKEWLALLPMTPVTGGIHGIFTQWFFACFQPICLLLLLFLAGVSAFGAPLVFLIPVFWGIGLGCSEAYYVQNGVSGWLLVIGLLLPPAVVELVALLMACSESFRMTVLVAVQLLPRSAHCGGLWQDFRLYCMRFLLLLVWILGAGALDVLLRLMFL